MTSSPCRYPIADVSAENRARRFRGEPVYTWTVGGEEKTSDQLKLGDVISLKTFWNTAKSYQAQFKDDVHWKIKRQVGRGHSETIKHKV